MATGIQTQLGIAEESTYNVPVAATRFFRVVDEKMVNSIARNESAGIVAGALVRKSNQWATGNQNPGGQIQMELEQVSMGLWLKHMFGGVATTGSGPYVHTFTPSDLSGKSLTVQVGKPGIAGVVPFTYGGAKVEDWEIACQQGANATCAVTTVAASEAHSGSSALALQSATYPGTLTKPFRFIDAALTIGGSPVNVTKASLKGKNNLDANRYFLGTDQRAEPLGMNLRDYTCQVDAEFVDSTLYGHFTAGDEAALVLNFTSGSKSLVITTNVRFDGQTPGASGRGILTQSIPCVCIAPTTDASAITAVYTTTDATP
jgi:hypothetical protein